MNKLRLLIIVIAICLISAAAYFALMPAQKPDTFIDAVTDNRYALVRSMISSGKVNFKETNKAGETALIIATRLGYKEIFDDLLNIPEVDINAKDKGYLTSLHQSIRYFHPDLMEKLLNKGANINIQTGEGKTPLIYAIEKNQQEVVKFLIKRGADITLKTKVDNDAMFYAFSTCNQPIVQILLDSGATLNAKTNASRANLLSAASKPSAACTDLFTSMIDTLNLREEQPDLVNKAFILATTFNNSKYLEPFIQKGVSIDATGAFGQTALMSACDKGYVKVVDYLLAKKANVNLKDEDGKTALMHVASIKDVNNREIVKKLLEAGADINQQDADGWTALMYAVLSNNKEFAQLLLEAKINRQLKSKDGLTALEMAQQRNRPEIAELLK